MSRRAIIITIVILLIVLVSVFVYIQWKRKKKQTENTSTTTSNRTYEDATSQGNSISVVTNSTGITRPNSEPYMEMNPYNWKIGDEIYNVQNTPKQVTLLPSESYQTNDQVAASLGNYTPGPSWVPWGSVSHTFLITPAKALQGKIINKGTGWIILDVYPNKMILLSQYNAIQDFAALKNA